MLLDSVAPRGRVGRGDTPFLLPCELPLAGWSDQLDGRRGRRKAAKLPRPKRSNERVVTLADDSDAPTCRKTAMSGDTRGDGGWAGEWSTAARSSKEDACNAGTGKAS